MVKYPNFRLLANDTDVTDTLKNNSVSISLKDEANEKADELTLKIIDGFLRPKYEDELQLFLGYGDELTFCGLFVVQTTSWTKHDGINISATGVNFSNDLKEIRSITYEAISIKDICSQVASRGGLELKSDFDDIYILSLAQSKESDLSFLNRLSRDYNSLFNIKNNTLYFMKKIKSDKKSDKLPTYIISANNCSSISIKHSNKTFYKSCKSTWHDTKENKSKSITVGSGKPVLVNEASFKDEADAKLKAQAKLQKANQGVVTGSLTVEGAIIFAGGVLTLIDTIEDDGEYQIKSVSHEFSVNGWSTSLDFER
jgi:phage protein D